MTEKISSIFVAFLENMNFKGKNQVYGACCYVQTTHQPVSTNSANILRAYCSIKYTLVVSMLYSCMCVPTYSSVWRCIILVFRTEEASSLVSVGLLGFYLGDTKFVKPPKSLFSKEIAKHKRVAKKVERPFWQSCLANL